MFYHLKDQATPSKDVSEDMDTPQLTREIANSLLQPEERSVFIPAEQQRMWSRKWIPSQRHLSRDPVLEQLWGRPLMRSYDAISGSEPCPETHRMLARGPRMRLDTKEKRIKTLKTHTDHRIWEDTPYISFSNCPRALEKLADLRTTRPGRGPQRIVVIDPRVRIELGLPILHCGEELKYYQVGRHTAKTIGKTTICACGK